MPIAELLGELDGLSHRGRTRRMVDLGRAANAGEATAAELLAELGSSADAYCRSLALAATYATRNAEFVIARLTDPSRRVRLAAGKALALFGTDAELHAALERMAPSLAKRLLFTLARRRRQGAIDAYVRGLREPIAPRIFDTIPLASAAIVEQFVDRFGARLGSGGFRRLAKRAPALATELVLTQLKSGGEKNPRFHSQLVGTAGALAARSPEHAIRVFEALLAQEGVWELNVARSMARLLLPRFPGRVFDALRARHESARPVPAPGLYGAAQYDKVAHRLGSARLAHLVQHAWSTLSDGPRARRWFLRLAPADQESVIETWLNRGKGAWGAFLLRRVPADGPRSGDRERAYRRWSHAAQSDKGVIDLKRLGSLPSDLRAREGRRHLHEVEWLASRPNERIPYAALLPFADAKNELQAFLGHPEGEVRSRALNALLGAIEHDPNALIDGLELVLARKFEQDPVRAAMLDALARLPRKCFRPQHLERVGRILRDAFDAADRSAASTLAAERLIVRLFRVDAAWGALWLNRLLEIHGSVSTLGLGAGLLPRDVTVIEPELAQLVETWLKRERAAAVIWLAQSLGNRRLRYAPSLLAGLERIARELPFASVAALALGLLRKEGPARFRELIPALLAEDRSFALLAEVARFVARSRQDLALPLVADRPMTGRFATGRTHWVIDFGLNLGLFTPAVQAAYQHQLIGLASAPQTDLSTQRFAVVRLARLPFVTPAPSIELAADLRQTVREIGVRSLAWLDGPEALPALLTCLGDDRARWAIYALRRLFGELPRADVLAHLRAVPATKVTVAKEVVRLLGDMGGDDAFDELIALDRPGVHRDVRIALLRALWNHLEREPTWAAFERALNDPDWVLASRLAEVPRERLSDQAEARLTGLYARLLRRPEPEARLELLNRCVWMPLRDERRELFAALLAHLDSPPDEAAAAARAVVYRMRTDEVDRVLARVRELFAKRQTVSAILQQLRPVPYGPKHTERLCQRLIEMLAEDPLAVVPRIELAGHLLGYARLSELFAELCARNLLHFDAMTASLAAVGRCVHPELLETRLASEHDPLLRRLALHALVCASSSGRGWSRERRARLEAYRRDPAPLVAAAAAYVFPPAKRAKAATEGEVTR